jgi:hypothetical protein
MARPRRRAPIAELRERKTLRITELAQVYGYGESFLYDKAHSGCFDLIESMVEVAQFEESFRNGWSKLARNQGTAA